MSAEILNGQKVVKIDKDDVEHEIMYWSNAVICSVLGANPPFEVIKGFVNRIWAAFKIDKIIQVRRGVFLVRFVNLQDKIAVEKRGLYFF